MFACRRKLLSRAYGDCDKLGFQKSDATAEQSTSACWLSHAIQFLVVDWYKNLDGMQQPTKLMVTKADLPIMISIGFDMSIYFNKSSLE